MNPIQLADILGHSSLVMIHKVYGHLSPGERLRRHGPDAGLRGLGASSGAVCRSGSATEPVGPKPFRPDLEEDGHGARQQRTRESVATIGDSGVEVEAGRTPADDSEGARGPARRHSGTLHGLRTSNVDRRVRRVIAPIAPVDTRRRPAEVESPMVDSVDEFQPSERHQRDEGRHGRPCGDDDQRSAGPASELQLTI